MSKTVIAIPYRNRKVHLDYYLEHTLPLLRKHIPMVHIVLVEQSEDGRLFNRGKLLNIAFKEYEAEAAYIITQDVDSNPLESTIINYYAKDVSENAILGILNSECNTLGGMIKATPATMTLCNGFPNEFWGYGVEDKALQNRCEFYGIRISKNILSNDPAIHTHFTIFHDVNDKHSSPDAGQKTHREYRMFPQLDRESQETAVRASGLNTLTYKVLSRTDKEHFTHLVVEL